LIEEGDSSHVNQPFDADAAVEMSGMMKETLDDVKDARTFGAILSQPELLFVSLYCAKAISTKSWINAFKKTNLNGKTRVGFELWCGKISHFLEGGDAFIPEGKIDRKSLLPIWWLAKPDEERTCILDLIDRLTNNGMDWDLSSENILALVGEAKGTFAKLFCMCASCLCLGIKTNARAWQLIEAN
jgi:hypothetical protein